MRRDPMEKMRTQMKITKKGGTQEKVGKIIFFHP